MKNIKGKKIFTIFILLFSKLIFVNGQGRILASPDDFFYYDTIKSRSENYSILHYYKVSKQILEKKLLENTNTEIFSESYNDFSRLILKGMYHSFDVSTIPLTHVFILEREKLILGLSQFVGSPYHIVLYSMDGKLLYKSKIGLFELKIEKEDFEKFLLRYPPIKECLEQHSNIVTDSDYYYIELNNCIINTIGVDSLLRMRGLTPNRYFPFIGSSTSSPYDKQGRYRYKEYHNFFDPADPLHDLILIGSLPYLLILNDYNGQKVNIPLISNYCK